MANAVPGAVADVLRKSTVAIHCSGRNAKGSGSGFIVAPGRVVTNAHVVSGASSDRRVVGRQIGGQQRWSKWTGVVTLR